MPKSSSKSLEAWSQKVAKKNLDIRLPVGFVPFNRMIGNPVHPNTGKKTDMFDFQIEYFDAVRTFHQIILNKSRKIGATETALRIILYNCFDHYDEKGRLVEKAKYAHHNIMLIAGNKQTVANKFIKRIKEIFKEGFTDMLGNRYEYEDIILNDKSNLIELPNGIELEAYPAGQASRGEANVICVFMSETAFVNKIDDSVVYDVLKPQIANIDNADFILESTPKGRRGFYYKYARKAIEDPKNSSFHYLEQPYQRGLGIILSRKFIEAEKRELDKDKFEQEYCCKFITSGSAAFNPEEIKFKEDGIDYFNDLD